MNCSPPTTPKHTAAGAGGWRSRIASGVLAIALVVPGTARPCTLEVLLDLPLEELLTLKIQPAQAATGALDGTQRISTGEGAA